MIISNLELQTEEQSLILSIAQRTEQFPSYDGMEELFVRAQCVDAVNLALVQAYQHLRFQGVREEQLTVLDRIKVQLLDKLSS